MASFFVGLYSTTGTEPPAIHAPAPLMSAPMISTPMISTPAGVVPTPIASALANASTATGTSLHYMVATAARESAFDPVARAETSTATGLFQFVDQTWLKTLKETGGKYGLGPLTDKIILAANGRYVVNDPQARQQILDLRKDPRIAALMAGELSAANAAFLTGRIGRPPTEGELYIAHFLGPQGAANLIAAAATTPQIPAAKLFPREAAANPAIFTAGGRPRSIAEVYAGLVARHDSSGPTIVNATALSGPAADSTGARTAMVLGYGNTDDTVAARVKDGFAAADPDAAFDGLFRTDGSKARLEGTGALAGDWGPIPAQPPEAAPARSVRSVVPPVALPAVSPGESLGAVVGTFAEEITRVGPIDLSRAAGSGAIMVNRR